ncbi:MAG: Molybdopterin oxidoreductase, iron-sulfur binding subunit [Labilithrix sp.]|nr:Molybdopterin oxidoreductase, iron-sulfur binding subunit [Labilithrix sp.]
MSRREPHVFNAPPSEDGAKVFWKSLEDKANPAAAQKRAESEFALGLDEAKASSVASSLVKLRKSKNDVGSDKTVADVPVGRRGFMFFAGASAALFAEGCARRPVEKIMPYSKAPEHVLPGTTSYYASVLPQRGDAIGVLVESHEGRPTKVEGNPAHSSSLGGTDLWSQAAIYDLYDPDRGTTPMKGARQPQGGFGNHTPATWNEFDQAFTDLLRTSQGDSGSRLRVLAEPSTSPTFLRLRDAILAKFPKAQVHFWTGAHDGNAREGAKLAFNQLVNVVPSYDQAKVILSLDSDFLGTETGTVRASHGFSKGRKLTSAADSMNRLYVVEPAFTTTGMNADHRLRLPAQDIERYLLALAKELAASHKIELGGLGAAVAKADGAGIPEKWLKVVATELAGSRARSVIVAGSRQPARVHALVHALNAALGNAGHTVQYFPVSDPLEVDPTVSVKQLAADIEKNMVGTLVIIGGNPVYDAPADLKLAERIRSVGNTIHLSSHLNETSDVCTWYVPRAHALEAWGDHRAVDGSVAIQQPLIAPLFQGRSDIEVLARISGDTAPKGFALVQHTVKGSLSAPGTMTRAWNDALKSGILGPAARPFGPLEARQTEIAAALAQAKPAAALSPQNLEITFAPCPKLLDGRHANNPLLLELPEPVTKVTWDNVGFVSVATAKALNVESGHVVRLTREPSAGGQSGGTIDIALWVTPGQADNSIALHLGWGRQKAGRYGDKHGFDVNPIRTTDGLGFTGNVKARVLDPGELDALRPRLRKVGMAAGESPMPAQIRPDDPFDAATHKYKVSQTQEHDTMEGRPVAIDATLEQYRRNPQFPQFPDNERKDRDQNGDVIGVRQAGSPDPHTPPLWGDWKDETFFKNNHRWGMAIDLTSCTGCNACVIACQIENNVPAVGKEQVWRGREMYWLRVDRYFVGLDENDPQIVFQPVACVQCEEAPCENVCPVNATEHSPEGLNDMAYNRCIGTRYCANNCPYKVRRFNFLNYHTSGGFYDDVPETEKMRFNPNVTVRMRGVMEKCTYCVQRIQEAKIKSKRTGKPIKDGDVVTACQQVCASECIVFGDLDDPNSKVAKWRAMDRNYRLLSELGTRPRTTYLGKIRNPNPAMGA